MLIPLHLPSPDHLVLLDLIVELQRIGRRMPSKVPVVGSHLEAVVVGRTAGTGLIVGVGVLGGSKVHLRDARGRSEGTAGAIEGQQ